MSADGAVPDGETRHIRLALLGVMFGLLLSMLDGFIVGTALPTIVGDLGGASLLSWTVAVVAAGSLAAALAVKQLPLRGRPATPAAPTPVPVLATR